MEVSILYSSLQLYFIVEMDKSWITKSRWTREYTTGVDSFLEFADKSKNVVEKILCPCKSCINRYFYSLKDVKVHLLSKGFFPGYVVWSRHGEEHQSMNKGGDESVGNELLAAQGLLTLKDENLEANENVFVQVMGPEHPGRVRTQGFRVTPTRFFPQSTTIPGGSSSSGSSFARVARLEEQLHSVQAELRDAQSFRFEVRQFMQQFQMHHPPPGRQ